MPGLEITVVDSILDVPAEAWDALHAHEPVAATPFLRHAFLAAMEASGSASPRSGWHARHLLARRGRTLVGAAPAYRRDGSDGDFSRDWQWASAAERAGVPYYPKLLLAVPFSPTTGRRVLAAEGEDRAAIVAAIVDEARALARREGMHALQVLFPGPDEAAELEAAGLAPRIDFQYHWVNAGYASPDDFLARFPSKRRNALRRERRAPAEQGITIRTVRGDELSRDPEGWAKACFALHRRTTDKMVWGMRWVNQRFYEAAIRGLPDAVEVVEARREGRMIGMAFNLASAERLYGRYWGCSEEHPFLHFNVALYHSIDECIRRGTKIFEGGAGGEHKVARGFEPAETWSAHAFLDPRMDRSVREYVAHELRERRLAVQQWREEHPRLGG
ncbi:MAG: GNAT family N-acetyltransferase [Anaeromyxobacteraceae bacterium]